jgi:lipopolysaccharide biosynthesis glycosyltransferase
LSKESRNKILSIYDKVKFKDVDGDLYVKNKKENIKYYSIECFNLKGYDKVIFQGADMLCLNSIDDLVNYECDLGMIREKRRPTSFNNGNMIVGKKYINNKVYNELLKADYSEYKNFGVDQKLYNLYFKDKITETPQKFNTLVSEVDFLEFEEIIFLHYIFKPIYKEGQERLTQKLIDIWTKYKEL